MSRQLDPISISLSVCREMKVPLRAMSNTKSLLVPASTASSVSESSVGSVRGRLLAYTVSVFVVDYWILICGYTQVDGQNEDVEGRNHQECIARAYRACVLAAFDFPCLDFLHGSALKLVCGLQRV